MDSSNKQLKLTSSATQRVWLQHGLAFRGLTQVHGGQFVEQLAKPHLSTEKSPLVVPTMFSAWHPNKQGAASDAKGQAVLSTLFPLAIP